MLLAGPLFLVPHLAMGLAMQPFEPYEQLRLAWRLLACVPVAAILALLAGRLAWSVLAATRGRGAGTFALVFLMAALSFEIVGYVNVTGDRDVGRLVEVDCVRYIKQTKGSRLEVRSWDDPSRTVSLWGFFAKPTDCEAGKPVRLVVHRGRLGAEWVGMAR